MVFREGVRRASWWTIIVLAAAVGTVAHAQAPARNGNVFDGTAHQPAAGPTTDQERAAGVAPPQQQQRQEQDELERLNREVGHKAAEANKAGKSATCSARASPC